MGAGELKLLIVDDEGPARSRLAALVGEVGGWHIVGEAANGDEALQICQDAQPDVVLLDIRMPGMDGLEVADHLTALARPPAVVFTTAYDEYAVRAFEAHALGYLLKPVRRERLLRALEHAVRIGRLQMAQLKADNPELGGRRRLPVTRAGKVELIPVERIVSFHADQKYVRMVYAHGDASAATRECLIDESLRALEEEFADEFMRVHRNALVRIAAVESFDKQADGGYALTLRGVVEPQPVSRRHVADVRRILLS